MMHDVLTVAVISAVTVAVRFLPFVFFRKAEDVPETVKYLGKVLPGAVMGMLVIFCLKDLDLMAAGHGITELLSAAVTAASYLWKKDTSLSVIIGTACYMLLSRL